MTTRTGLALASGLAAVAALLAGGATDAAAELDGRALFVETHKCVMCHSVPPARIEAKTSSEKMKGPDLPTKRLKADPKLIADFLRKQAAIDGQKHQKGFKGSDEELQTILDWLGSLEAQD